MAKPRNPGTLKFDPASSPPARDRCVASPGTGPTISTARGMARIECSLVYHDRRDAVIQETIGTRRQEAQEMLYEAMHFLLTYGHTIDD